MNRLTLLAVTILALAGQQFAQAQADRRTIEVSGSAERLITPNEFTFKITLVERIENKQKITIEQQEASLRNELANIGVDVTKDLSIFDVSSTYFRQKKIRDVLGTKDYRLKVRDLNKIARLQETVDRLNVAKLDLIDTDHSDLTTFRRETKMDAMKAAREKAVYLLGSIGERIGKPIYIKEVEEESPRYISAGVLSNTANYSSNTFRGGSADRDNDTDLSFSQIKLRYVIVAKFEIE